MARTSESGTLPEEADYHQTRTYKAMDAQTKKLLARYKRETGASVDQIFYELYLEDLKNVTEEEKKAQNGPGEIIMVCAALLCVFAVAMWSEVGIFVCTGVLIVTVILFVTGCFNSYETEKRRVRRRLKKLVPRVQSFEEWRAAQ